MGWTTYQLEHDFFHQQYVVYSKTPRCTVWSWFTVNVSDTLPQKFKIPLETHVHWFKMPHPPCNCDAWQIGGLETYESKHYDHHQQKPKPMHRRNSSPTSTSNFTEMILAKLWENQPESSRLRTEKIHPKCIYKKHCGRHQPSPPHQHIITSLLTGQIIIFNLDFPEIRGISSATFLGARVVWGRRKTSPPEAP